MSASLQSLGIFHNGGKFKMADFRNRQNFDLTKHAHIITEWKSREVNFKKSTP